MKRFAIKFSVVILLFFIPVAVYRFHVIPNLSGEIGRLGMIPFGEEFEGLDIPTYRRYNITDAKVVNVSSVDSLDSYKIVTIGDSFSQFEDMGYQWKFSSLLNCPIANYVNDESNVFNRYVALLNSGYIKSGQLVVVETVERSMFKRLEELNFDSQFAEQEMSQSSQNGISEPFLNRYFSWLRLKLNIDNSIITFRLSKQCFTHRRFGNILHIYNSHRDMDGDLLWEQNNIESLQSKACENIQQLIDLSDRNGVSLIILIASDKYDTYEPWIEGEHPHNPTLDKLPKDIHLFNTKPCLQEAIYSDVMDVYKFNSTHWSVVGADIVADSLYSWMQSRQFENTCIEF